MSDETIHCEGTSSYDCKLGTCHGLPQCGTCCKCTGVCIFEEKKINKPTPVKPGETVCVTPQQMAESLSGFVWGVQVNGDMYDASFTGQVNAHGNIEMRLGKKRTVPTPAPPTGANRG